VSTEQNTESAERAELQARQLVERAVRAVVAPTETVERRIRPDSDYSWSEPSPLAGFRAAQQVKRLAEAQVYKYAVQLRAEGIASWRQLADMLAIPYDDGYSRAERAFELMAHGADSFTGPRVSWTCGGLLGCGQYVTDRGPYNGWPADNEDGHAEGCRRLATETEAYEHESEERDRRDRIMDEAYEQLASGFARQTADRARWVVTHGGQYRGWSTSECLAVALVLDDAETLHRHGYPQRSEAIARVVGGMGNPPRNVTAWLELIRAAATGQERAS
jgi:hypothetical protein